MRTNARRSGFDLQLSGRYYCKSGRLPFGFICLQLSGIGRSMSNNALAHVVLLMLVCGLPRLNAQRYEQNCYYKLGVLFGFRSLVV